MSFEAAPARRRLFIARRYFLSPGRRGALLRYFAFNFRCSKANGIDLTIPKPAAARRLFWRMQSRNFAAYGNASCREQIKQIISLKKDGTFAVDLRFFRHHLEDIAYEWPGGEPVCGSLFSQTLVDMLGPPRTPDAPIEERHRNLAWATQAVYEDLFFHLLDTLQHRYGHSAVALAGGCAYNSVANVSSAAARSLSNAICNRRPATRAARSAPLMSCGTAVAAGLRR